MSGPARSVRWRTERRPARFVVARGHVAALGLGTQQRKVRLVEQRLGVRAVGRVHGDTDARRDMQVLAGDPVRHRHRGEQFVGAECRVGCARHFRQQDDEFVPAQPADRVGLANARLEAPRDRLQHPVADGVAERIVDVLEPVHVDEQHRQ